MLDKYHCLSRLNDVRTDEVVVSMMSNAMPWAALSDGPLDFASVDTSMGHGADFAMGLAMARPDRRVIALNGDGSMLMCLGTLVTMAQYPLENLVLIILENGTYEVTGSQPVPGAGKVDYAAMARGAGLEQVYSIASVQELEDSLSAVVNSPGPLVMVWHIEATDEGIPKPAMPIRERTQRLKQALADNVRDPGGQGASTMG